MGKCDKCNKIISKNKPGLECSRCEKIVHLTTSCSELTNKQLAAVRAAENLEWTCRECREISPKRNTIVVPDDDDEEGDKCSEVPELKVDIKQLLGDISREMEKTIKREMRELSQALQFHSDKMDEVIATLEACQGTISDLKRENVELSNKNNNLEARVGALEQRLQEKEQRELSNIVEICNVPQADEENTTLIAQRVAGVLKQHADNIVRAVRLPGKNEVPGPIQVQLGSELLQTEWIRASKTKDHKIKVIDIVPTTSSSIEASKTVYIREALTPNNKYLLWFAKKELNNAYKYIWVKKGIIRVRKEGEKEKPTIIRTKEDVNKLK